MLYMNILYYIFIMYYIYSLIYSFTILAPVQSFYVRFIVFDDVHALSATNTYFKWELMLYCLHCTTLSKAFLLLSDSYPIILV